MNEPTPPITGQAAKLTTARASDTETLVCVVHLNAKPPFAECHAITRAGVSRLIGRSPDGYRFDSVSAERYDDGTVRMWLSCWPAEQSGTEAAVRWIDFPNAVAPASYVDQPARNQANAATGMAHSALDGVAALDARLTVLEA